MAAKEGKALAFDEMFGTGLTVVLLKCWLVVEEVELRRGADHVQEDDAFGTGGWDTAGRASSGARSRLLGQQRAKCEGTQAHTGRLEKGAAGESRQVRSAECGVRNAGHVNLS